MSSFLSRALCGAALLTILAGGARAATPGDCSSDPTVLWAAADFDGNQTIDWARVEIESGHAAIAALCDPVPFALAAQLTLTVRDVDADSDPDLIVSSPFDSLPRKLWLNDGRGRFSPTDPDLYPGLTSNPPRLVRRMVRPSEPAVSFSPKSFASIVQTAYSQTTVPVLSLPLGAVSCYVPRTGCDLCSGRAPPSSF